MSKLYIAAAKVLKAFSNNKGGMKSLIYNDESLPNSKKSIYALAIETYKYLNIIITFLKNCRGGLYKKSLTVDKYILYIMIYELLFGHGPINGGGHVKKLIMQYKLPLQQQLARLKIEKGVSSHELLLPKTKQIEFPRYVRVNTLKTNINSVIRTFKTSFPQIKIDELIPDLLIFPPGTDLHDHLLVQNGHIILQDKASCMSALALNPNTLIGNKLHIIDACAAPGNKTTYLAALLKKENTRREYIKLDAFEKNNERYELLNKMLKRAGANHVETFNQDFLSINWSDSKFNNVNAILVDPTCSGSGMIHRLAHADTNIEDDLPKLKRLSQFQINIVSHALKSPTVQRVIYSTCSTHIIENENVVKNVLEKYNHEFELIKILPKWLRRGDSTILGNELADKCVRVDPTQDETNGFFVACFQRKEEQTKKRKQPNNNNNVLDNILPKKRKKNKKKKKKKKKYIK